MTVAARPSPLARAWSARWPLGAEIVLFLVLMFVYEWVRDLVAVDDLARPSGHALDVIDVEKTLGFFVEPDVHDLAHSVAGLNFLTTWTYTLAHVDRVRDRLRLRVVPPPPQLRGLPQLVLDHERAGACVGYWLFPLAPPRLTDLGLAGPHQEPLELGGALSWFEPFRNEFAAMPSMHVGYTFLFALTLVWLLRPSPWRWLALLWPATMLFVVVSTANHWSSTAWAGSGPSSWRSRSWRRCAAPSPPLATRPGGAVRVAMVTEYAYPVLGGVPEHVHNLSRELAALGHEVTVLTSLAPLGMKRRRPGPRRREPGACTATGRSGWPPRCPSTGTARSRG